MRSVATLTASVFTISGALASPMQVLAQEATSMVTKSSVKSSPPVLPPRPKPRLIPPPASLKENLKSLTPEQIQKLEARGKVHPVQSSPTLLDEVGKLAHPVSPAQVKTWRQKSRVRTSSRHIATLASLYLGEWELAKNREPEKALHLFQQAQHLTNRTDSLYGLAAYDTAIALFYEGAYQRATETFQHLLTKEHLLSGFNRRNCALFARHASACAGYHSERAKLGIPEPRQLDPLCAASGLAISLRALGAKYDRASILPYIHYTGEGSSLQDILDAAKKLGYATHVVSADDKGLILLPKPIVSYVEHDHFIAVTGAGRKGVSYICSDCGEWPGGTIHLTWTQWHKLEATLYVNVSKPGSQADKCLTGLPTTKKVAENPDARTTGIQLASASLSHVQGVGQISLLATRLANHVFQFIPYYAPVVCGYTPIALHCPSWISCPTDHGPPCNGTGPSSGDPTNLATGEEELVHEPDMTIYNPIGPSVVWSRIYNSLRHGGSSFGADWDFSYDVGTTWSGSGAAQLSFPNGDFVNITPVGTTTPSASNPKVACTVSAGTPLLAEWDYNSVTGYTYFTITFPDRTKWITRDYNSIIQNSWQPISKLVDPNGNSIVFNYNTKGGGVTLLSIADQNNQTLLTIHRDSNYNVTEIDDRYGRSVYYHIGTYATVNVSPPNPQFYAEVDHVSQIVTTGTANPPDRYAYGYQDVYNGEGGEQVPLLHTMTVPSPTGTGTTTATINYAPNTCYVSSIVDANNNTRSYTVTDANHTKVTVKDSANNTAYSYTAGFDMNMNETTKTDGSNTTNLTSNTYADPNDPYRPSQTSDANGNVSMATWDQYGNCLTSTSPRNTVTTYTISYANYALGELTSMHEGSKQTTSFTYYEPSGLIHTMTMPLPGTSGGTQSVTRTFTYDSLGNLLTESGPGNNAASTITTTFNYTTDGSYSQTAAIHQPLTRTDNLGHVTHMRYDSQSNLTQIIDALGHETDVTYNLANQGIVVNFAATGESGTGRDHVTNTFLYPGGPQTYLTQDNENWTQVYQTIMTYGAEGELLSRTGSTQPYSASYDAQYRLKSVRDGNNNPGTQYSYNTAGYLSKITYNNSGVQYDTIQITAYDNKGNPTQRIDGRGVVTNLVYTDPESKLTDVQYPASTSLNVHLSYDSYGRNTGMSDGTGSQSTAFDDRDKPTSVITTYTGLSTQTMGYAYYPDGSRKSLTLPDTTSFQYTYDGAGRATGLTNPSGQSWSWTYADNDWLTGQNAAGTVVTTPTRDARGFITDLQNTRTDIGHTPLSNFSITYGTNLTVSSVVASLPAAPASFSGTTNYVHDTKVQLTQESSTRGGGYTNNNAYDAAGNPTTFKGVTTTFNSNNQDNTNGHSYDGNGNPIVYKYNALTFDSENRMTAFGSVLTAGYRGDGLRAWKQTSAGKTYYLYDGETPILEENASGTKTAINTFGHTGLLARSSVTRTLLYTFDAQGNVAQQLDAATGNIVASYMFDAFGTRSYSSSDNAAINEPFTGFGGSHGYYTDWETGLQLLTHRYYDPTAGRFLTRDPIHYIGGINLYECVGNSPLGGHDTSGLHEGASEGAGGSGEGEDPIEDCAGDAIKYFLQMTGKSPCITASLCQFLSNCIVGMAGSAAIAACKLDPNPVDKVVCGCAMGALLGFGHTVMDGLCNYASPCKHDDTPNLCNFLTNMLAGCASGIGAVLPFPTWIISGIVGGVEGWAENQCDEAKK